MSSRRERHLERLSPEDKVLGELRRVAERPYVKSIEDHFAGYFDELGITFKVADATTDEEVISLRNDVLKSIVDVVAREKIEFKWQFSIYRGEDQVVLAFPGDCEIPAGERLQLIYSKFDARRARDA